MIPNQNNMDMDMAIKKKAWRDQVDYPKLLDNVLIARRKVKKAEAKMNEVSNMDLSDLRTEEEVMAGFLIKQISENCVGARVEYYKAELEIWCCVARFNKEGVEKWFEELKERGTRVMEVYEEVSIWPEEQYRKFCEDLQEMINLTEQHLKEMEKV
jgi:hypothetical protein